MKLTPSYSKVPDQLLNYETFVPSAFTFMLSFLFSMFVIIKTIFLEWLHWSKYKGEGFANNGEFAL